MRSQIDGPHAESLTPLLVRLAWALFGPIALFLLGAYILRDSHAPLSLPSLSFIAVVVAMIGLRWLEIARYEGTTMRDRPATSVDLRRYALGLLIVSGCVWSFVHAVG